MPPCVLIKMISSLLTTSTLLIPFTSALESNPLSLPSQRRTATVLPYGFQSGDISSQASGASNGNNGDSYAGSIGIDTLNGIAYLTGGTYGSYFDSTTQTANAPLEQSECFVSVLELPKQSQRKTTSVKAIDTETVLDPSSQPQLLYTRRFGTASHAEVCSAVHYLEDPTTDTDNMVRKVVSIGHTAGEGGLFTSLRRAGSDFSTVYGFLMDLELNFAAGNTVTGDALNGGMLFHENKVQYPVAFVSSPHESQNNDGSAAFPDVYVLMMESDSDALNPNFPSNHPDLTAGGGGGVQMYGAGFDMTIKKLSWKDAATVDSESASSEGLKRMLKEDWSRTYTPKNEEDVFAASLLFVPNSGVDENLLLVAGSTRGSGVEFGGDVTFDNSLDGFVFKIDASASNNPFSVRIKSGSGGDEVVHHMCSQENFANERVFYVVGTTTDVLDGAKSISESKKQVFIRKMNVDTLEPIWTEQLGTADKNGDIVGTGCAVTADGNTVYLSGIVKDGNRLDAGEDGFETTSAGGDDVFIAKYEASSGRLIFLRQIGTSENDSLATGGGISVDPYGNAVLLGTTRGSLMRWRGDAKASGDNAADVFMMSVSLEKGEHRTPMEDVAGGAKVLPPPPTGGDGSKSGEIKNQGSNETAFSIIGLTFVILSTIGLVGFSLFVGYKFYKKRGGIDKGFLDSNIDLARHLEDFEDVEVEIRHSATGGIHGMYHFEDGKKDDDTDKTSFSSAISPTDPRLMNQKLLSESNFMDDEDEKHYDLTEGTSNNPDDPYADDDDILDDDDDEEEEDYGSRRRRRSLMRKNRNSTASYRGLVDSYDTIWKDCKTETSEDVPKAPPQHAFNAIGQKMPSGGSASTKLIDEDLGPTDDREKFQID